eukprot:188105_1
MSQISNQDLHLLEELTLLTHAIGCFNTNFGLCNSNCTSLSPFLIEHSSKMNELKAIQESIPSFTLYLSFEILEYSHQFATSDFMHLIISHFNQNPSLIPENMKEYHESAEFKQQFDDIDLEAEVNALGMKYSVYKDMFKWTNKQILNEVMNIKKKQAEQKEEDMLKEQLKHVDIEAETEAHLQCPYSMITKIFSDIKLLKMINERKNPKHSIVKEEPKNIDGLRDYIETMNKTSELHFPLKFECFGSRQIMHRMVTDHERIVVENEMITDPKSQHEYDVFVKKLNKLKEIVKFIQNNTSNSRIYSIPTFCGDGQYWNNISNCHKYYGTVFVVGETTDGNLLGVFFDQNISI